MITMIFNKMYHNKINITSKLETGSSKIIIIIIQVTLT